MPTGFDLLPVESVRDEDTHWLAVATRQPPPATATVRVVLGPQSGCHDVEPLALRTRGASRARRALVSVRCDGPPRADFSIVRGDQGAWVVARSGCSDGFFPCPAHSLPDEIVAEAPIGVERVTGAPLATRESTVGPPRLEAAAEPGSVVLRWVTGEAVNGLVPGVGVVTPMALAVNGVVERRIELGAVPGCAAVGEEVRAPVAMAGALGRVRCAVAGGGERWFWVTHDEDMVRVRTGLWMQDGGVGEAVSMPVRVALPRGTRVLMR